MMWPQVIRILRKRSVEGVSPGTWAILILVFATWSMFAISQGVVSLLVANLSSLLAASLVVVLGIRHGWSPKILVAPLGYGALIVSFWAFAPILLQPAVVLVSAFSRVPQLRTAIRSTVLDGISTLTWALTALQSFLWIGVFATRGIPAALLSACIALFLTIAIVVITKNRSKKQLVASSH